MASHLDLSPAGWVPATELFLRGFSLPGLGPLSLLKTLPFSSQASPGGQTGLPVLPFSGPGEGEGREMEREQQLRNTDDCLN